MSPKKGDSSSSINTTSVALTTTTAGKEIIVLTDEGNFAFWMDQYKQETSKYIKWEKIDPDGPDQPKPSVDEWDDEGPTLASAIELENNTRERQYKADLQEWNELPTTGRPQKPTLKRATAMDVLPIVTLLHTEWLVKQARKSMFRAAINEVHEVIENTVAYHWRFLARFNLIALENYNPSPQELVREIKNIVAPLSLSETTTIRARY